MKYYKKRIPEKWQVFAYESDGSQDAHIAIDMISISKEEALEIANQPPVDAIVLDILRTSSTQRNWSFPPAAYQEAIGQIAVDSSSLEVFIRTVIWHIAGLDSVTGRAFTGKARIAELTEMLKALIEHHAPKLKDATTNICTRIKSAFDRRSVYIHQVWTVHESGLPGIGKLFLERYERLETITPVPLSDMYQLSVDFRAIQADLMSTILHPLLNTEKESEG